jgi:2-polyprenyl-3-methyl-5-hydroxy-6-metoxy-1,4-benzoquinol methylase
MKKSTQELQHLVGQQSRVIDIGTGDGTFIKLLMEQGFQQVAAHEIPGTDLSKLAASGCMVYQDFDYASVPDHAFDAVTLLDVAEHVRDIHQLFRVCARILRDDGIIYLHTPCVSRLDRMMHMVHQKVPPLALVARVWQRSRTSIFHLQIYSPQSLCLLLQEAGFTNISITVENELSWPVQRYVRVYICDKLGLPQGLAPVLVPLLYPFIATRFFNANKAIVHATKNVPAPGSVGTR